MTLDQTRLADLCSMPSGNTYIGLELGVGSWRWRRLLCLRTSSGDESLASSNTRVELTKTSGNAQAEIHDDMNANSLQFDSQLCS